jgi:hypothetical protein
MDGQGTVVKLPVKIKAIFVGYSSWYLEITHSPETLGYAGRPGDRTQFAKGTMGRVFPSVVTNRALWRNRGSTLESLIADDDNYIYIVYDPAPFRRFGLIAISWAGLGIFRNAEPIPGWPVMQMSRWDKKILNDTYLFNCILDQDKLANKLATTYTASYRGLLDDLKPETLAARPQMLNFLSWKKRLEPTDHPERRERSGRLPPYGCAKRHTWLAEPWPTGRSRAHTGYGPGYHRDQRADTRLFARSTLAKPQSGAESHGL